MVRREIQISLAIQIQIYEACFTVSKVRVERHECVGKSQDLDRLAMPFYWLGNDVAILAMTDWWAFPPARKYIPGDTRSAESSRNRKDDLG